MKKFAKACRHFNQKIKDMRTQKLRAIFKKVNQMLVGYYHYYGITDNGRRLNELKHRVERSLFYWLNRRSQKRSYTWEQSPFLLDKLTNRAWNSNEHPYRTNVE